MGQNTVSTSKGNTYIILFGQPGKKKPSPQMQNEKSIPSDLNIEKKDIEIFEDTLEYKFDPHKEEKTFDKPVKTSLFNSLKKIFMLFTPGKKRTKNF